MKKAAFFSTLKYVRVPSPLTVNRNMRRFNMAENDRKIFFSFNLFSVFLFTLPIVYLAKKQQGIQLAQRTASTRAVCRVVPAGVKVVGDGRRMTCVNW
ncbi:hypothetical protein AK88_01651 [Plasmodium fragile]|uniref:Uncharacterized protein n=1 Tax=Plasmodium fragile TaxID=5857 RepID=A0A0D9QNV4_PLAFR|nr:uncharacterized protein AK88_01651 [Plasmodium fragile]KJP88770.1 hypothetical protein AK88_01651 [Plasmodium fragile]